MKKAMLALLIILSGCTSADEKAAQAGATAIQHLQQGAYAEARISALQAVRNREDVADYWLILATSQNALGDATGAYRSYYRTQELDRTNVEALQNLARISLLAGKFDEADRFADQLLLLNTQDRAALLTKGFISLRKGNVDEALRRADSALAVNPADEQATILRAEAMAEMGDEAKATEILKEAIATHGSTEPKLEALLAIHREAEDDEAVTRTLSNLSATTRNEIYGIELARHHMRAGRIRDGVAAARNAMKLAPNDSQSAASLAGALLSAPPGSIGSEDLLSLSKDASVLQYLTLAGVALELGFPEIALQDADAALDQGSGPTNIAAAALKASALYTMGETKPALNMLNAVLRRDENNQRALRLRALHSIETGDHQQAIRDAQVLIRDNPRQANNRILLARAYESAGDSVLAAMTLKKAYYDIPGAPAIVAAYVESSARRGDPAEGLRLARAYAARYPDSAHGEAVAKKACRLAGNRC